MNILSADTLEQLLLSVNCLYPGEVTTEPAPGDTDRWFVLQGSYVLSGLHIVKKADRYVFCTIPQVSTN